MPDCAVIRVLGVALQDAAVLTGAEINASLRTDRDSGADARDLGPVVWSPLVLGDAVTLQVELPEGVVAGSPRIRVPRISHFFRLPFLEPNPADGCHQDPACHPGWETASRAPVLLLHTDPEGGTGVCTGTLLEDGDPGTRIPYLLTAHHCCSDHTRASSIEALWLTRPSGCGGPVAGFEVIRGGADLLYTSRTTDTTLLRLRRPAPTGALETGRSGLAEPRDTGVRAPALPTLAELEGVENQAHRLGSACGGESAGVDLRGLCARFLTLSAVLPARPLSRIAARRLDGG